MYCMLINKGIIKLPWLPSLDGYGRYKGVVNANMAHLRLLLAKDQGQFIIIERQNVSLMSAAVHPSTVAALRFYAQHENLPEWNGTAIFLEFVSNWFTILNVRSAQQDKR